MELENVDGNKPVAFDEKLIHREDRLVLEKKSNDILDVDELLHLKLVGSYVEQVFENGSLPKNHKFSWENVASDPKGDHGEYELRSNWYKTMSYNLLHTGGFLRLCTNRGRVYWIAQNSTSQHTTPDWKIHFSCEIDDIPKAWNALAALWMESHCEIGMKATYDTKEHWPEGQRGR